MAVPGGLRPALPASRMARHAGRQSEQQARQDRDGQSETEYTCDPERFPAPAGGGPWGNMPTRKRPLHKANSEAEELPPASERTRLRPEAGAGCGTALRQSPAARQSPFAGCWRARASGWQHSEQAIKRTIATSAMSTCKGWREPLAQFRETAGCRLQNDPLGYRLLARTQRSPSGRPDSYA